uniref:Flagellar basal-body rod protein FlgF n=1 Tax=Ammonifex degensii TaxID=42838 RepID=A0A7C1JLE3_9THEO
MLRSLYAGVTGMRNHQLRMDVVANNIANVNTTAFKAMRASFQDNLYQTLKTTSATGVSNVSPLQVGSGMNIASVETVFIQGALQLTGRSLDLAIQGNGFFTIKKSLDSDAVYYTREGAFFLNTEGYLVNSQGYYVLDTSGAPIQITDQVASIQVARDGTISYIMLDGTVNTLPNKIGITYVQNQESLLREGQNLFSVSPNTATPSLGEAGTEGRGTIEAGFLEMSNVDLSLEFTNMIVTQRGYQANARVITTSDEMLRELIDLKR